VKRHDDDVIGMLSSTINLLVPSHFNNSEYLAVTLHCSQLSHVANSVVIDDSRFKFNAQEHLITFKSLSLCMLYKII
jgi:hypothetical protein